MELVRVWYADGTFIETEVQSAWEYEANNDWDWTQFLNLTRNNKGVCNGL